MATNVLSVYDPYFYANEGLIALEASLGMAGRVYRGYDKEAKAKGSTIEIRRPGTFVAQDAPSSDQNVEASGIEMRLDYWKEVKFSLTDKELTFTGEEIIKEHIRPAVYVSTPEYSVPPLPENSVPVIPEQYVPPVPE
ncbi:MAG: P22 phage major capsid protein family protein [Chlorobium sp.]